MKRSILIAMFAVVTSLTAFASAEGKKEGKGKFPMQAQEFKQKHEAQVNKAKAKLEERIKAKNVDPAKAKLLRARFESVSVKVGQAVNKVTADGKVTREEAKDVSAAAQEARSEARKQAREARKQAREAAREAKQDKQREAKKPRKKTDEAPKTPATKQADGAQQ